MKRSLAVPLALGLVVVAGLLGPRLVSRTRRERLKAQFGTHVRGRMERMMKKVPPNSPPGLVMAVLPQLRDQSEQILQLLRDQNAMLRERPQRVE